MHVIKEPYAVWTNTETSISYLFHKTKDGSISLSLKSENLNTELMHSTDGAFSETLYLYEDVVKYVCNNSLTPIFLSIGLGMGYIEILVCAYFLKNFPNKDYKIFSFEKEKDLKDFFKMHILCEEIPTLFSQTYNNIIGLFCTHYGLKENELFQSLQEMFNNKKIIFYDDYNLATCLEVPVSGIFFDAFSANTAPDLWTDNLLDKILNSSDTKCSFATYASRSSLKNSLLAHGFKLDKKPGYGGKKESTFAWK